MTLYTLLLIISVLCSPIIADELIDLSQQLEIEHGASIALLSSEDCKDFDWQINSTTNKTDFVRSLIISNLFLEANNSLTLTPGKSVNGSHVLTISGDGAASLPNLYLDTNVNYTLKYQRKVCGNITRTLLQASVNNILNDACAPFEVTGKHDFTSYNYPNNYPLQEWYTNTQCRNVTSQAASIYVTFNDLDIAEGHSLELLDPTGPIKLTFNSKLPGDAIVSNTAMINFLRSFNPAENTIRDIKSRLSGRGFNITLETLECGGELKIDNGEHFFNVTEKPEKCIWILSANVSETDPLKVLNFTLSDGLDNVVIYDSNSRKNNFKVNRTSAEYLNSTSDTIIIEYTSSNKSTATLTWSTFVCPDKCDSVRRCINPSERCNGANDCGDWSDELHCNGTAPLPKPEPAKASGVPGLVVVFVIIPLAMIVGILGTIFFPRILARIRGGRYQEFREYSDVS